MTAPSVFEMRIALTAADYEQLVEFYCRGLDLEPAAVWTNQNGRALMLEMGRAALEIFDENYAASVDQIEAGRRVSGPIRFAFQVPDVDAAVARLVEHGAVLVQAPVVTPWGDRNARLQAPDGMQITLYEAAGTET